MALRSRPTLGLVKQDDSPPAPPPPRRLPRRESPSESGLLLKPTLLAGPQDSPPSVGRVALPGRGESGLWFRRHAGNQMMHSDVLTC
jgi:hypothetical protein